MHKTKACLPAGKTSPQSLELFQQTSIRDHAERHMHITFRSFCSALALILFTSCTSYSLRHDPQSQLLMGAANAFSQLKDAGKVPGFAPGDHGHLRSVPLQRSETIKYPFSVVMDVTKQNDHSFYIYRLTKDSQSSTWRLTAASRRLPDGKWENLKFE